MDYLVIIPIIGFLAVALISHIRAKQEMGWRVYFFLLGYGVLAGSASGYYFGGNFIQVALMGLACGRILTWSAILYETVIKTLKFLDILRGLAVEEMYIGP